MQKETISKNLRNKQYNSLVKPWKGNMEIWSFATKKQAFVSWWWDNFNPKTVSLIPDSDKTTVYPTCFARVLSLPHNSKRNWTIGKAGDCGKTGAINKKPLKQNCFHAFISHEYYGHDINSQIVGIIPKLEEDFLFLSFHFFFFGCLFSAAVP